MEALARIVEIRDGKPGTDKRPPNVKVLPFKLNTNYGRLSELCHVAGGELLHDFAIAPQGEEYATLRPSYRPNWAKGFLCVHIAHVIVLSLKLNRLHREIYSDREFLGIDDSIKSAVQILIDEGFWKEES